MHTVSFFSFKGGVGRTNLLLNVAYGLARDDAFVVVADWDLHAPGLTVMEAFSQPKPENAEDAGYPEGPDVRRGVLDYLGAILDGDTKIPDPVTMARPTRIGQEVRAESTEEAPAGDIWFIPAGRFNPDDRNHDYHQQLLRVQGQSLAGWEYKFKKTGGGDDPVEVLNFFRSRILEIEHPELHRTPDYLLLDSRTGMTEIGDLLMASRFADRMVVVTGLNDQNLSGLEAVIRDLQRHVEPGDLLRHLTLVVSPVPEGEDELKAQRLGRIQGLIDKLARPVDDEPEDMPILHQIPYHPRIALSEEPMLQTLPDSGPAQSAQKIIREIERKRYALGIESIIDASKWIRTEERREDLEGQKEDIKAFVNEQKVATKKKEQVYHILYGLANLSGRPPEEVKKEARKDLILARVALSAGWYTLGLIEEALENRESSANCFREAMSTDLGKSKHHRSRIGYHFDKREISTLRKIFAVHVQGIEDDHKRRYGLLWSLFVVISCTNAFEEVREIHRRLTKENSSIKSPVDVDIHPVPNAADIIDDIPGRLIKEWIKAVTHEEGADPDAALAAYLEYVKDQNTAESTTAEES